MKRVNNLYDQISNPENLRLAYWKAKRSREAKKEIIAFSKDLDKNMDSLRNSLISENLSLGDYHYFRIYDPKERLICAASFRERVLHHAIMNVCNNYFESYQIYDSYATRIDKGQYAALERAKQFSKSNRWFCKLDVRKYFDNINHALLLNLLEHKFKDKKLLSLFAKIIDSYHVKQGCGIPIGNLSSQYFANFLLAHADHFIKETLKTRAYLRYMDDMVLWENSKMVLLDKYNRINEYIQNRLQLVLKPPVIQPVEKGLPLLGYVLCKDYVRLNKTSKKRFIYKYKNYEKNLNTLVWSQKEFSNHITPLFSFVQYANSTELRRKLINNTESS